MTHVAYFYERTSDVDQNTNQSIQDYINGGWDSGENEGDKWIGRELSPAETVKTTPDIVVNGEPLPKTGYIPPTPPFKPW